MKKHFGMVLVLICSFCLVNLTVVSGQDSSYMHVTIHGEDHYVFEPSNAPVRVNGTVFTLTGNVDSINFISDNSVLDGNGYTVTGENCSTCAVAIGACNITVKNLVVTGGQVGISLGGANITVTNCTITGVTVPSPTTTQTAAFQVWAWGNNTISGNQIVNNSVGIYVWYASKNNTIVGNNVSGNLYGIHSFDGCSNNSIYNNNFNNTHNLYSIAADSANFWDNGITGNYWSDYSGTDNNADGIGDTPYVLNENNQDNYPLMAPADIEMIPEFPVFLVLVLFVVGTLLTQFYYKKDR